MKQLILTPKELIAIGFKKKTYSAIKPNDENPYGRPKMTTYEIPCLNGHFRFNTSETEYIWYHDTIIGDVRNSICLNIVSKPELFTILSAFKVKFNIEL